MTLTDKQKEFVRNANKRYNLKIGARRCGKSYLDVFYRIASKIRQLSKEDGLNLILGVSKGTIERNVLKPMREIYGSSLVGNINSQNIVTLFGEEVYCLGAEKANQVSKIQGSSVKYCYCDELAKFHKDVFEMVKGSLDKPYSCLDGALNPESKNHWLKVDFIDKIETDNLDVYMQHYTIFDNPFLSDEFVENLCKEYKSAGNHWYNRLIMGQWENAEGLIYPMFDENVHVVDTLPESFTDFYISMDYGIQNATAMGLWGRSGGKWYMVREFHHSGRDTGKQKTDAEYYEDLKNLASGRYINSVIIDPSASSFIALIRQKGEFKIRKADNDVINGISAVASALHQEKIYFHKSCKNIIDEFNGYMWDDKSNEDRPIKDKDHQQDQMRYLVYTLKVHLGERRYL